MKKIVDNRYLVGMLMTSAFNSVKININMCYCKLILKFSCLVSAKDTKPILLSDQDTLIMIKNKNKVNPAHNSH